MRVFVGLILQDEIKEELFKLQKSFPRDVAKINWVAKKRLHLTLKFLGEINENEISKVTSVLNEISFDSFEVKLGSLGVFSNNDSPFVLWVDLIPNKKIIDLQQKVDAELLPLFKSDQKFSPHLVLGRIKLIKHKESFSELVKELKFEKKRFSIKEFYLIQSTLTKDGPKYKILEKFNT
jgi:RNA 2',3'-cyclic 3'-phosphodiesterase